MKKIGLFLFFVAVGTVSLLAQTRGNDTDSRQIREILNGDNFKINIQNVINARLTWRYPGPQLQVLRLYYNQPAFITALAGQARAALDDETLSGWWWRWSCNS